MRAKPVARCLLLEQHSRPRVSLSFYRAGAIQGLTAGKTLNPAWSARTKMLFHEVEKQARMLGART